MIDGTPRRQPRRRRPAAGHRSRAGRSRWARAGRRAGSAREHAQPAPRGRAAAYAASRRMVPATPLSSAKVSVTITAGTRPGSTVGRGRRTRAPRPRRSGPRRARSSPPAGRERERPRAGEGLRPPPEARRPSRPRVEGPPHQLLVEPAGRQAQAGVAALAAVGRAAEPAVPPHQPPVGPHACQDVLGDLRGRPRGSGRCPAGGCGGGCWSRSPTGPAQRLGDRDGAALEVGLRRERADRVGERPGAPVAASGRDAPGAQVLEEVGSGRPPAG